MENASKALIMAGSVLMAILVIGILVFGYNQISHVEQTKEDSEQIDKMTEYMMRFEQFNRGRDNALYGSELLSLANLQEDYNESDARVDVGYDKIDITVKINKELKFSDEGPYKQLNLKIAKYRISDIIEWKEKLDEETKKYEEPQTKYNNRSVKYYSSKNYREIAVEFGINIPSNAPNTPSFDINGNEIKTVEDYLRENHSVNNLLNEIEQYKILKTTYNEFRTGKKFYCSDVVYNKYNGRLKEMIFEEII